MSSILLFLLFSCGKKTKKSEADQPIITGMDEVRNYKPPKAYNLSDVLVGNPDEQSTKPGTEEKKK